MKAIINIELDEKCGPGLPVEQRFSAVMSRVRQFFTRSIGEIQQVTYAGPDGTQAEHTAVISIEFAADKAAILETLHKISKDFNQDCVAVLFCSGEGRLAGPGADLWGPFNINYFRQPRPFVELKQAA